MVEINNEQEKLAEFTGERERKQCQLCGAYTTNWQEHHFDYEGKSTSTIILCLKCHNLGDERRRTREALRKNELPPLLKMEDEIMRLQMSISEKQKKFSIYILTLFFTSLFPTIPIGLLFIPISEDMAMIVAAVTYCATFLSSLVYIGLKSETSINSKKETQKLKLLQKKYQELRMQRLMEQARKKALKRRLKELGYA